MKETIKQILSQQEAFKDLDDSIIEDIVKSSELLSYQIGQTIASPSIMQNKILLLVEGMARLIEIENNQMNTIFKLGVGDFVGLGSMLRGKPCENVSASSKVTAIAIPDSVLLKIYKKNNSFSNFCDSTIFKPELLEISKTIISKEKTQSKQTKKELSNILASNKVQLISTKEYKVIEKDTNYLNILGSNNVNNMNISEELKPNIDIISNNNMNIRIYKIKYDDLNITNNETNNLIVNSPETTAEIKEAPYLPEKSNVEYEKKFREKEFNVIRGSGDFQISSACLQMIATEMNLPFRKDSVDKILRETTRSGKSANLELFGSLTSLLGLHATGAKVSPDFAARLQTPSLIPWKKHFAVVIECNYIGLKIASPEDGLVSIEIEEFKNLYPEGIEILLVERKNSTPNKKFNVEWFLPSLKKYKGVLSQVLLASFIVQLFGLANPLLVQIIIDKVISQRSLDTLQILGFALVVVTLIGGVISSLRTFLFTETTNRIDTRLGAEVIDHLLRLPLNYFDRRPVGELGSRISELEKIRNFLTGQALTTILDASFSVIYIIVLFFYSSLLTFIALAVIPIQVFLTLIGAPLIRRQIREVASQDAKTQSHLIEVLTGIQTVKAQNVETVSRWKWQNLYSKYISRTFEKTITTTALGETSQVFQKISQLLVLWVGASLVLKGQMSLGQLIAFRIISGYVTQPLLRLSTIWQNLQELKVSFERLADIVDTPEESSEKDQANIPLPLIKGTVKFNKVTFAFNPNSADVLKNIDLEISPGTFVGIVGQSGSGKSTLMKLLPRLYEPKYGEIYVDGFDINKTELYSLRRQIGIVPQEPLLFSGTVSENIALTQPDVGSDEIVAAARAAEAHDFVMGLPSGYSTNVGERGASLSGGQRQRIAIARTLLSQPRLLIMDEATSALDYQTERKVCENIRKACKGITVFFITHRLSTIKNADQILMLHDGSIAEIGTHDDLISKQGRYYALYRQQEAT